MSSPSNPLEPSAVKLVEIALAELKRRNVTHDLCPRCDTFDWNVEPLAINAIPLRGLPAEPYPSYFPVQISTIQIVCKNCGYTMFHNLKALGLA